MAPDFGAKIYGGEDCGSIDPDVVEDVGPEWSDKVERMGVEVGDTRDVAKEIAVNELLLWDLEFLAAVVDDGILVRVAVGNKGAGGGGEKIGEDVG